MAISYMCGFEIGDTTEAFAGGSSLTDATVQSTTVRSGTYALRINPSGAARNVSFQQRRSGGTQPNFVQSMRFYLRIASLPSADTRIATGPGAGGTSQIALILTTTGVLSIGTSTSTIWASSTNTLSADGQWHRIDWDNGYSSGNGSRVFVDGVQWTADTVNATSVTPQLVTLLGPFDLCTTDLYFDDFVVYDSALPATLSDYKLSLLKPTSDNAVGNWKRNDGLTTTSLWDAVDNTPPQGTAVTAVLASRYVQNGTAGSSSANDNLDINCAAYNTVTGLSTSSQIKAVMAICNDAQQVTTGSPKSGALAVASNPAVSDQTFDFGLQHSRTGSTSALAQNTFPTAWGTHVGAVVESPSVTISSGPVVRVKRTGTYTRVLSVDFMGVYVMWEAATKAPPFSVADRMVRRNSLLRR